VHAEQDGQRREEQMVVPAAEMSARVDPDRGDDDPADDVGLRGKAHDAPYSGSSVRPNTAGREGPVGSVAVLPPLRVFLGNSSAEGPAGHG